MRKIPDQIKRLIVPFAIVAILLLAMRYFLVPRSFGKYGHYRADAVDEIAGLNIMYAGHDACSLCHTDISQLKSTGNHMGVSCEVCHEPAQAHIDDPTGVKPHAPRDRVLCSLCHGYNPSRPTGLPQIIPEAHNPTKPCFSCHNPHDPKPPHPLKECSACHLHIVRLKAESAHSGLPCERCHGFTQKHVVEPRGLKPSTPRERGFCGACHAAGAPGLKDIPRVDIMEHYNEYQCYQCHYPHLPEVD